ncbi:tether containing UBX domain for GLUT4-like [Gigantopelta aegis]|uniref:tether containing UBX domain for GLUT4-like n=1 Tax=Gigantopelta aegis TaxID=1735272 RepID=UPI001B88892E|nr:tether containing UBX domain for GLUT4-like [Gigantopelta aegis]
MATVQVLCPNGRRQNVKITPNSKLLQILEEVCQKQGFLPSTDYTLIHGRVSLDLSLSFRYANLSNNVKLELVKTKEKRAEEEVLIALQMENGDRLQSKFPPTASLWDVLLYWENQPDSAYKNKLTAVDSTQNPPLHPVCIYMREEVVGQMAIQMMSLRQLGLTGGKAVIRFIRKSVEDGELAEIVQRLEKDKAKQAKLEEIASRRVAEEMSGVQTCSRNSSKTDSMQVDSSSSDSMDKSKMDFQTSDTQSMSSATHNHHEEMEVEQAGHSRTGDGTAGSAGGASVGGVGASVGGGGASVGGGGASIGGGGASMGGGGASVGGVTGKGGRGVTGGGAEGQRKSQSEIERLRSLNIPGVEIITPDDFNDLTPEEQQTARRLAQRIMPQLMGESTRQAESRQIQPVSKPISEPQQPQFVEFKFPESTKGKCLYSNDQSDVKRDHFKPCSRKAVLYNLDEPVSHSASGQDPPDDFFEVTETDIKKMVADQQKKMADVIDPPLMTQAMRQARLEEHYAKYDKVVIRIQFPDRVVLQGLFNPRERVHAIYKFVKEYLEEKSSTFYLYTSPPKCVLNEKSTLVEARLVPATLMYFGSEIQKDHHLSKLTLSEISSRSCAEDVAFSSLPCNNEAGEPDSSRPQKHTETEQHTSKSQTSGKLPKWLKLGKK